MTNTLGWTASTTAPRLLVLLLLLAAAAGAAVAASGQRRLISDPVGLLAAGTAEAAARMIQEDRFGPGIAVALRTVPRSVTRFSRDELDSLAAEYANDVNARGAILVLLEGVPDAPEMTTAWAGVAVPPGVDGRALNRGVDRILHGIGPELEAGFVSRAAWMALLGSIKLAQTPSEQTVAQLGVTLREFLVRGSLDVPGLQPASAGADPVDTKSAQSVPARAADLIASVLVILFAIAIPLGVLAAYDRWLARSRRWPALLQPLRPFGLDNAHFAPRQKLGGPPTIVESAAWKRRTGWRGSAARLSPVVDQVERECGTALMVFAAPISAAYRNHAVVRVLALATGLVASALLWPHAIAALGLTIDLGPATPWWLAAAAVAMMIAASSNQLAFDLTSPDLRRRLCRDRAAYVLAHHKAMVGPETPLIVFLISTAERQAVLAADALLAGALDKAALDKILGQFARDTEAGDLTKAALNAIQNLKAHLKGTLLRPGPLDPHGPAEAQPGPDFDALIDPLLDPAPVPRTGEASKDPPEQAGGPNPLAGKPALS